MQVFERILGIILPVFIIIATGYGYARLRGASVRSDMAATNRVTMDVLAPLLIFTGMAAKEFDLAHNAMLILAGALICIGSGVLAWPIARLMGYDVRSFVPPMMYNNAGNMGVPLAVLAFGPAGLSPAVALFVAASLVYFSAGIKIVGSGKAVKTSFWRLLLSPMMIAMLVGIVFAVFRVSLPSPLFHALKLVGDAAIPIMLFALGVRMLDANLRNWHIGLVGALACPITGMLVAQGLDLVLPLTPEQRAQMYLFAALPPAVFCFMIAEQYKQEPDKVASIVLIGNLASLAFVPVGLWLGLRP